MAITGDGNLHIYVLNVGQADTSVIVTPGGRVVVIDAAQPAKLVQLLKDLGLASGMSIGLLIITHPHNDHFSGANRLVREFDVKEAIFAPFWHDQPTAPPTYCQLIATLLTKELRAISYQVTVGGILTVQLVVPQQMADESIHPLHSSSCLGLPTA